MFAAVDRFANFDQMSFGLLLVRVVTGITFAAHGYNKFFRGGRIAGTARWFDSMGMKPNGRIHALLAASTELGSGMLLAAGFLTPLAGAGIVGVMVVAAWTHRANGFFIVKDGWEYNLVLSIVAIGVAVIGPGRYSLDWVLGIEPSFRPVIAFVVSAGLGLASGVGLLVAFYRPPAPAEPGS